MRPPPPSVPSLRVAAPGGPGPGVRARSLAARLAAVLLAPALALAAGGGTGDETGDGTQNAALERLRALPYLDHVPGSEADARSGTTVHDLGRVAPGLNLYDGFVVDLEGRLVHAFTTSRYVVPLPGGRVYAYRHDRRVGLYGWDMEPVWERELHVHHDLDVSASGGLLALTKEVHSYRGRSVEFDVVVEYDVEGGLVRRWSTFDHLDAFPATRRGPLATPPAIDGDGREVCHDSEFGGCFDLFHANAIQALPDTPLGQADPRFRAGLWLLTLCDRDQVVVVDPAADAVTWSWQADAWTGLHDATMLSDGRILVFVNGLGRGRSSVVELAPGAGPGGGTAVWPVPTAGAGELFTAFGGSAQRLPNGNLLIAESDAGRAVELTPDGARVWEWLRPERVDGRRATLYRIRRLPLALVPEAHRAPDVAASP